MEKNENGKTHGEGKRKTGKLYKIGINTRIGSTLISFYDWLIFLIIFLPMLTNEMETVKGEYVQNIK